MKFSTVIQLSLITYILISNSVIAEEPTYGNIIVNKVGTVYDGDTFSVTINQWPEIIGKNISVRLKNVDTPEMKGACYQEILKAREAKKFTVQRLRNAKKIELKNMSRDKYFRIDADVFIDGEDLTQELINNKLGVAYSGGVKIDWCATPSTKKE
jgi:micrococcal nuclease